MILNISTFYKKNKHIFDILADVFTLMVIILVTYIWLLLDLPDSIGIYLHNLKINLLDSIGIFQHNLKVHLNSKMHFSELNLQISELKMQLLELEARFSNLNKDLASMIQSAITANTVHSGCFSDILTESNINVPSEHLQVLTWNEQASFDIMTKNMDAYMQNQGITLIDIPSGLTIEEFNRIIGIITTDEYVSTPTSVLSEGLSEAESVFFENMVNAIKVTPGYTLSLYSSVEDLFQNPHPAASLSELSDNSPVSRGGIYLTPEMLSDPNFLSHENLFVNSNDVSNTVEASRFRQAVIFSHPIDGPAPLPSYNIVREAPSISNPGERLAWLKEVAMQKYWAERVPFLSSEYNRVEVDHRIVEWMRDISEPSDLLLEEARNIPLPEQTEEEIKSLSNEPSAASVPLPPQSDEELDSLLDDSQNKD